VKWLVWYRSPDGLQAEIVETLEECIETAVELEDSDYPVFALDIEGPNGSVHHDEVTRLMVAERERQHLAREELEASQIPITHHVVLIPPAKLRDVKDIKPRNVPVAFCTSYEEAFEEADRWSTQFPGRIGVVDVDDPNRWTMLGGEPLFPL
jgi:hypothetical protein